MSPRGGGVTLDPNPRRVTVPAQVLRELTGDPDAVALDQSAEPVDVTNGVATGGVWRVRGTALAGREALPFRMVVKSLVPPAATGIADRHHAAAENPGHWAYWRREALAYRSGLLPRGPGLAAPRCFGVVETDTDVWLYLADVSGEPAPMPTAAHHLGAWQGRYLIDGVPAAPWLAGHQLAQRIAATDAEGGLDFGAVRLGPALARRLAERWDARGRLLTTLASVPATLCHGDFHAWNLFVGAVPDGARSARAGPGATEASASLVAPVASLPALLSPADAGPGAVPDGARSARAGAAEGAEVHVIDWGAFGVAPVGTDLAYLVLSAPGPDNDRLREPYLDGLAAVGWHGNPRLPLFGYCATAGLTGIARTHWLLSRDPDASVDGYAEWSAERVDEALALGRRLGGP